MCWFPNGWKATIRSPLYFQCSFFSSAQALTLYENQMRQFALGNITAQELAASLDQAYTTK